MTEPRALRRRIRHGRGIRGALIASALGVASLALLAVAGRADAVLGRTGSSIPRRLAVECAVG